MFFFTVTFNINCRDVQRKNVVKMARAKTNTQNNTKAPRRNRHLEKKLVVVFFEFFFFFFSFLFIIIK